MLFRSALKKWRVELIGVPFHVYTDHKTLTNFLTQRDLSRRQARWQELLSQYEFDISYIAGAENDPADAMSQRPPAASPSKVLAAISTLQLDESWAGDVRAAYENDWYTRRLADSLWTAEVKAQVGKEANGCSAMDALQRGWLDGRRSFGHEARRSLLFVADRLVVPRVAHLRERIFRLAHDTLGHYGTEKSYAALRASYYWPNMQKEIEELYVPGCEGESNVSGSTVFNSQPSSSTLWRMSVSALLAFGTSV